MAKPNDQRLQRAQAEDERSQKAAEREQRNSWRDAHPVGWNAERRHIMDQAAAENWSSQDVAQALGETPTEPPTTEPTTTDASASTSTSTSTTGTATTEMTDWEKYQQEQQAYLQELGTYGIPGATDRAEETMAQTEQETMGYDPTYWQAPDVISRWHHAIQSTPPGTQLPEFMTPELQAYIEETYQYMSWRNGGAPESQWKLLNAQDGALGLLAALPTPPAEYLWEGEERFAAPVAGEQGGGATVEMVKQGQAAWMDISEEQRAELLADPTFDITQFDIQMRQQILADPAFNWDALPDWQKWVYNFQSNPLVQKAMATPIVAAGAKTGASVGGIFGVPGKIVGGILGAGTGYGLAIVGGEEYNPMGGFDDQPTLAAKTMFALNALAQTAEQYAGFMSQMYAVGTGETQREGETRADAVARWLKDNPPETIIQDVLKRENPAFEAGNLTYESLQTGTNFIRDLQANLLPLYSEEYYDGLKAIKARLESGAINKEQFTNEVAALKDRLAGPRAAPGQDFILGKEEAVNILPDEMMPAPTQEVGQLEYVLAKYGEYIAEEVAKGRDVEEVKTEVYEWANQYASAFFKDFAGQMIIDPLNVLPKVEGAAMSEFLKWSGGENTPLFRGGFDEPSKVVAEWKAAVGQMDATKVGELNAVSRWLSGYNKSGEMTAGMFGLVPNETLTRTTPQEGMKGWVQRMMTLAPENRARMGMSLAADHLGAIASHLTPDEFNNFFKSLQKMDLDAAKNIAGDVVGSAEFYTVIPMMRGFDMDALKVSTWDVSAENRGLMLRVADVLGMEPGRLVEDLGQPNSAARVFEQLRQVVMKSSDAAAKALLEDMDAGRFTVADLTQIGRTFNGPDALPWHPAQFQAMVLDAFKSHAEKWAVDYFKIQPGGFAAQLAKTLKGVQSVILLGYSPKYIIDNVINGEVTMAASGVYGMMSMKQIDEWTKRFGFVPDRMADSGMFGHLGIEGAKGKGSAIADAMRSKGTMGEVQKVISNFGEKYTITPFAGKAEGMQGARAMTVGMKQMWGKIWERGRGFSKMDAGLVKQLTAIDPLLPEMVYRAIEGGISQKEVMDALTVRQAGVKSRDLITGAAQKMGMSNSQAITLLEQAGIMDALDGYLKTADTPEKVDAAFRSVMKRAEGWIDIRKGQELRSKAEHVANALTSEGENRMWEVILDNVGYRNDQWIEHYMTADEVAATVEAMPDEMQGQKSLAWLDWYEKEQRAWKNTNTNVLTNLKGVMQALGLTHPDSQRLLALMGEEFDTWGAAYDFRLKQYAEHYEQWKGKFDETTIEARMLELEQRGALIDEEFKKAFATERVKEEQVRDMLVEMVRAKYGDAVADVTMRAYQQTIDFRAEMTGILQKHRKEVKNIYGADRRAANRKFYQGDYLLRVVDMRKVWEDGVGEVQKATRGGGTQKAEGGRQTPKPPTQPTPTMAEPMAQVTPPPAPPQMGTFGEGSTPPPTPAVLGLDTATPTRPAGTATPPPATGKSVDVWKIASENGMSGVDAQGNQLFGAKLDVIKFVKKWGGSEGGAVKRFDDITPELMQKAVDAKAAWAKDQLELMPKGDQSNVEGLKSESEALPEPSEKATDAAENVMASQPAPRPEINTSKHLADLPQVQREIIQYGLARMKIELEEFNGSKERDVFSAVIVQGGIDPKFAKEMFGLSASELGFPPGVFRKGGMDPYQIARSVGTSEPGLIDVDSPFDHDGMNQLARLMEQAKKPNDVWMKQFSSKTKMQDAIFAMDAMMKGLDKPKQSLYQTLKNLAVETVIKDPMLEEHWEWARALGYEKDALANLDGKIQDVVNDFYRAASDGDVVTMEVAFNAFNRALADYPQDVYNRAVQVMDEGGKMVDGSETYRQYHSRLWDEMGALYQQGVTEKLNAQAELNIREAEARGEMAMTREVLREQMVEQAGLPEAQADVLLELFDANAKTYGPKYGLTPEEFYNRIYGGVTKGGLGELQQTAYHGSPFKFDKFSLDHMGSGEGAQAYGWGLYFAGDKAVADWYREKLAPPIEIKNWRIGSIELVKNGRYTDYSAKSNSMMDQARAIMAEELLINEQTIKDAYQAGGKQASNAKVKEIVDDLISSKSEDFPEVVPSLKILLEGVDRSRFDVTEDKGQLYAVEIPDENYLLWDRPFKEQSIGVRDALEAITDRHIRENKYVPEGINPLASGENAYRLLSQMLGDDKAASLALREAGISGIKYLDGSSRGKGEGNYNYVIFDDAAIQIKETFYQVAPINRSLSAVETENYARALVRAGVDELRRAVRNETNPADRVAILDAAHNLDPKMAEEVGRTAVLYQENKGAVTMMDEMKGLIHAYEASDFSTFVHEPAHIFLRQLMNFENALPEYQAAIAKDFKAVQDWTKVGEGKQTADGTVYEAVNGEGKHSIIERDGLFYYRGSSGEEYVFATMEDAQARLTDEMFARGFEKYITEGSAPTKGLARVFELAKQWMTQIYRAIIGSPIDVKITDEIRGVFDRLLTDEPITREGVDMKARVDALTKETGVDLFAGTKEMAEGGRRKAEPQILTYNIERTGYPDGSFHVRGSDGKIYNVKNGKITLKPDGEMARRFSSFEDASAALEKAGYALDAPTSGTMTDAFGRTVPAEKGTINGKPVIDNVDGMPVTKQTEITVGKKTYRLSIVSRYAGGSSSMGDVVVEIASKKRDGTVTWKRDVSQFGKEWPTEVADMYASMLNEAKGIDQIKKPVSMAEEFTQQQYQRSLVYSIGDIVKTADGTQATVAEVRADGSLALDNGRTVSAAGVSRVAEQANMLGDFGMKSRPEAVQSNMLFQKAPPTRSEAFKRWFGDSKVVDEKGNPLVVYHGTKANFEVFDIKKAGASDPGLVGKAFYFTPEKEQALSFAENRFYGKGDSPNVLSVYLKIDNPYYIKDGILPDGRRLTDVHPQGINSESGAKLRREIQKAGYDGVIFTLGNEVSQLVVFKPEQIKSVNNRGTFEPTNPNILFQKAELPLGGMDQASGFIPEGAILDEAYTSQLKPLLEAMQEEGRRQSVEGGVSRFDNLTPELQAQLMAYARKVTKTEMPAAKLASVRYGEGMRDWALLNYNKKYGFDKAIENVVPYQFWATRTGLNSALRVFDRPAWFANYFRLQRFASRYERDLPDRLKGKIKIELPFLPEWTGRALYVDPFKQLFPWIQYAQPFDQLRKDKNAQVFEAERVLQEWAADGTYTEEEIAQAAQTQQGAAWEAAVAEAAVRRKAEISNPLDFMATLLGPAWYLTMPAKALGLEIPFINSQGEGPETIGLTTMTRTGMAMEQATQGTWAEPLGKLAGLLAKPEQWIRKQQGLPQFGEYGEYYIDRQLANLVAEGLATVDEAQRAMIERQGEVYDMAVERVQTEIMLRTPTAMSVYAGTHGGLDDLLASLPASVLGGGILPEGELRYRGLKEKWNAAWTAYDNGDTQAIGQFFEDHPEYQVYLMKGQSPEERLRNMLTSQIWDSYMGLDKATRRVVTAQLGAQFEHAFLNSETRSPESLSLETLSRWSMMLGNKPPTPPKEGQGAVDVNMPKPDEIPMLEGLPTQTRTALGDYEAAKAEQFPNISQLQNLYFNSSDEDKKRIISIYPELREYWDWKRQYIEANPAAAPFLDKDVAQGIISGELNSWDYGLSPAQAERLIGYYNNEYSMPVYTADYYLQNATPFLMDALSAHQLMGTDLTEGAYKELRVIWEGYGKPGESFDDWLENVIYATSGW